MTTPWLITTILAAAWLLQGSCHYKDVYSMKWYAAYPDTLDGFAGSW